MGERDVVEGGEVVVRWQQRCEGVAGSDSIGSGSGLNRPACWRRFCSVIHSRFSVVVGYSESSRL